MSRAADDFATIRVARDEIRKKEDDALSGKAVSASVMSSSSWSPAPQRPRRAADDAAAIAQAKRALKLSGDVAYPKAG